MKLPACTGKMISAYNSIKGGVVGRLKKRSEVRYSKNFLQFFGIMMASAGMVVGVYATLSTWIIPMVRALTETTKTMPADYAFNGSGYASGSGVIVALSNEVRIATSSTWVNGAYLAKKSLTLRNLSGQVLPASGSAQVTINTKELFDAGKLQADCDDLRIAHIASASSSVRTEIPRSFQVANGATNCSDSSATIITFPRQEQLWIGQATSNYELYYSDGSATAPTWPKEKYLTFDGSNDSVSVTDDPQLNPTASMSASLWFRRSSVTAPSGSMSLIFKLKSDTGNVRLGWGVDLVNTNKLQITYGTPNLYEYHSSNAVLSDTVWHHLVIVRNGTSSKLYLDGVLDSESTRAYAQIYPSTGQNLLFSTTTWARLAFAGNMDDIRLYSRAISASEVSELFISKNVTSELAGFWNFDEGTGQSLLDISGNQHNGTLGGSASVSTDDPTRASGGVVGGASVGGKNVIFFCPFTGSATCVGGVNPITATGAVRYSTGSALEFDGVNDSVSIPNLNLSGTGKNKFSVFSWVNPTVLGINSTIFEYGVESIKLSFVNNNKATCTVRNTSSTLVGATSTTSIVAGQWVHVGCTYDGSNVRIYFNGVEEASSPQTGDIRAIANEGGYGTYQLGFNSLWPTMVPSHFLKARLDELVVYDKALTPEEITDLYAGGTPIVVETTANTTLLYHFDENGSDPRNAGKVIDASGNGNHGTISGAKYVAGSPVKGGAYAGHEGILVEEGTTNLIANPSFESNITDGWAGKSGFNFTSSQIDVDGNTLIGSNNVKDVYYYDTSADADGGAWRNDAAARASSWYKENFSSTRGKKREFPEKAWIVATDLDISVIDAIENKLWMRFNRDGTSARNMLTSYGTANGTTSVFALNGKIYAGNTATNGSVKTADFVSDSGRCYYTGSYKIYSGTISQRNDLLACAGGDSSITIVNSNIHDIAAARINGKNYLVAATDGGVSVINETDGTVAHIYTSSNTYKISHNVFIAGTRLYVGQTANGNYSHDVEISTYPDITLLSGTTSYINNYYNTWGSVPRLTQANSGGCLPRSLYVTVGTSTIDGTSNTLYCGTLNSGLSVIQEKFSSMTGGSVKFYTKDEITEELIGDMRGMWSFARNATLSNNDTVENSSAQDTDLTSVGGATVVNGVRGNAFQFNGSSQYLKQKTYLDQTGATWGHLTHGLSLVNGSAFFRAGETLSSEKLTNNGFETGNPPANWSVTAGTTSTAVSDPRTGSAGSKSIQLTTGGSNSWLVTQSYGVTSGKVYQISGWVKNVDSSACSLVVARGDYSTAVINSVTSTGSWTYITGYFAATATESYTYVLHAQNTAGKVCLFDDVSLKEVTSPNLATYKGTDTGSTPYMIAVKDSANKTAWGYLGNADAGETLGTEKFANTSFAADLGSWWKTAYGGAVGDALQIATESADITGGSLMIKKESTDGQMYVAQSLSGLTVGALYQFSVMVKSNTTSASIDVNADNGGSVWKTRYVSSNQLNGWNKISVNFIAQTSTLSSIRLGIYGGTGIAYFDNASFKQITDIHVDGVHIMSTRNGTTRNWAGIESGFNYNDSAYTFEVRRSDMQIESNTISLGAWIKTSQSYGQIMSKYNGTVIDGLLFSVTGNKVNYSNGGAFNMSSNASVSDNNWHHVVYVQNGSDDHRIYLDGNLDASSSASSSLVSKFAPFMIGARLTGNTPDFFFNGSLDEPFVTAEALTGAQVLDMYNKGLGALNHSAKTDQKLIGTSNSVTSVWANSDASQIYAGTNGAGGGVSVIKNGKVGVYTDSDSVVKSYSTATSPALVSNDTVAMVVASSSTTTPQMIVGSAAGGISVLNSVLGTSSRTTTAPFYKYGTGALKIDNTTSGFDTSYVSTNTLSVAPYTMSAFAYKDGSQVSSADAILITDDQPSTGSATTYEDVGGGWTRLSTTFTGQAKAGRFGVQVKNGKAVYIDGVQLENKGNLTTYADGSLGTGYSWAGAAGNSTSTRSPANVSYSASSVLNPNIGAVSMWVKMPSLKDGYLFEHFNSGNRIYITTWAAGTIGVTLGTTFNSAPSTCAINAWCHILLAWNGGSYQLYTNGSVLFSGNYVNLNSIGSSFNIGGYSDSSQYSNANISDLRIYDQSLATGEVTDLYYQGLINYQTGTENDDRYDSGSKTYTSPVIDLGANGEWGGIPVSFDTVLNGGTVSSFMTKTSADGNTWSDWIEVEGNNILSNPRRYLQWKADLTASAGLNNSPVITGATFKYIEDTTAPINPMETAFGFSISSTESADLTSSTWYNYATPKFTWEPAIDNAPLGQSASGVNGYHVLLTKTADASPSSSVASGCYKFATEGSRSFIVGTSPAGCSLTDGIWYLRVQAKDNSGNVSDPVTLFTYKYDGSIPNAPISLASTTVGYSANNTFGFYWPTGTDNGPSGVVGYEYKTGAPDGEYSEWQYTTSTSVEDIPAYEEGQNFIYVRSLDAAGNYSGIASNNLTVASFYYNASAPTAPTNISISPDSSEDNQSGSNVFTVTWDRPASFSGEIAKYYYCVNCTPSENNMTETSSSETVNRTLTDIALATQQGRNTLYILAEDNNMNVVTGHGNRNFSAYATADFYASTIAPSAPTNLSLNDASDRDSELWRLSLTWNNASEGGVVAKYQIYRSLDGDEYTKMGETTSTAYTDADLEQSKKYYYKVRAVDNAGSTSLFSSVVYRAPEGKYTTPPTIGGVPVVTPGSSTAIIKWTTGREAYGTVEYGKTTAYGSAVTEASMSASHSLKVTGLAPGVTYHFRTQSLDDSAMTDYDRAEAYSGDYSFTTLNSAAISTVTVEEVNLTTAVISWSTSSLATSTVEYGETMEYGLSQEITTAASESSHIARLTGLKHSTTYNFRVRGITSDGDDIFSENYQLQTLMFPKVTAVVLNTDQNAGGASVVLAWATNVPTTGEVEYQALKPEAEIGLPDLQNMSQTKLASISATPEGKSLISYSGKMELKHLMRLEGLDDGMIYVLTIRGRDQYGNQAISDPIRYVTGEDTRAPVISNIVIETPLSGNGGEAKASAIVSWETDEPAIGQILWGVGTGSEYGSKSETDAMPTTKHTMVLRDLVPTTSYHLKIESTDASGNMSASQDTVVVTPTAQQAALDIVMKNLEDVFGFLRW